MRIIVNKTLWGKENYYLLVSIPENYCGKRLKPREIFKKKLVKIPLYKDYTIKFRSILYKAVVDVDIEKRLIYVNFGCRINSGWLEYGKEKYYFSNYVSSVSCSVVQKDCFGRFTLQTNFNIDKTDRLSVFTYKEEITMLEVNLEDLTNDILFGEEKTLILLKNDNREGIQEFLECIIDYSSKYLDFR